MKWINEVYVYTDGGSRGNPGPAAIAVVIYDKNRNILKEYNECIGEATNNVAEYKAIIKGLELTTACCRKNIFCFLDSELVVRQLSGSYRIKAEHLRKLFYKLKNREKAFEKVIYNHVKRENKYILRANRLVIEALETT